jgi:hypothetical protein
MKTYFLLRKKYNEFPNIISSTKNKNKVIHMVLHYMEKEGIQMLVKKHDFDPLTLGEGKVLVEQSAQEYFLYEIVNTGYIRDYMEFSKIDRVNVIEFDMLNDEEDLTDDITATMKELLVRYNEK